MCPVPYCKARIESATLPGDAANEYDETKSLGKYQNLAHSLAGACPRSDSFGVFVCGIAAFVAHYPAASGRANTDRHAGDGDSYDDPTYGNQRRGDGDEYARRSGRDTYPRWCDSHGRPDSDEAPIHARRDADCQPYRGHSQRVAQRRL